MSQIEDLTHQLFTLVLNETRIGNSISFENTDFPSNRGPVCRGPKGDYYIDLSGECGLLGHSHPLIIKTTLMSALTGKMFLKDLERKQILEQVEESFSKILGLKVFIVEPSVSDQDFSNGRVPSFLSSDRFSDLKNGKTIVLKNIFSEDIGLSIRKEKFSGLKSSASLNLSQQISRFLIEGGFYGENGLVKKRELQIRESLQDTSPFQSNYGLIVNLKNNIKNKLIKMDEKKLIFPLSFNQETLSEISNSLEGKKCS